MRLLGVALCFVLVGCGAIVEPVPCTLETAHSVTYDLRGRPVMYDCRN